MAFLWEETRLTSTGPQSTWVVSVKTQSRRVASRQNEGEAKALLQLCLEHPDETLDSWKAMCKKRKSKDRA